MIDYKKLIENALIARENSYSPYSNFKVGACVLTDNQKYYLGTNVENSSYGGTICAERSAISTAISYGDKKIVAIAIVSSSGDYTFPCGICRQVMAEFGDIEVVIAKSVEDYKVFKISELLLYSFTCEDIKWEQL